MKKHATTIALALAVGSGLLLCGCSALKKECKHETLTRTEVAPTCEGEGYTLHQCTECEYSFESDTKAPLGHVFSEQTVPPTCESEGYTQKDCSVCALSFKTDLVEPLSHTMQTSLVEPTCEDEGYTEYACQTCELTYQTDFVKPLGHTLSERVTEPTCEGEGYTTHACSACEYAYQTDTVAPLGHTLVTQVSYPTRTQNGTLQKSCACGYRYSNPLLYFDVFPGGIVDTTDVLAKGVDVSCYQHVLIGNEYQPLNWTAIKDAGFDFAILKAGSTPRTVGDVQKGGIEPVFEMNYLDARKADLELGAYFYSYATTLEQVKSDAELLISWLEGKKFEYPIYFDLEDPSLVSLGQDMLTEMCITFISTLQENGYYGALYSNNQWLTQNLHGDSLKDVFDIWYARYPEDRRKAENPLPCTQTYTWITSAYGPMLGMWQYTDYGVIEGIDPEIKFDFDVAYRDYPALIKHLGLNGFETKL